MIAETQKQKAKRFLALHNGGFLILPNIWNPIGAKILEVKGYPVAATASAAISNSLGYQDGERIRLSTLLDIITRIARCVDIPVTADIETGYANTISELEETLEQVIKSGVVGVNIEDSIQDGTVLRSIDEQCERLQKVRQITKHQGIHLVINARIDSFISGVFASAETSTEDAIIRANAYIDAGADCVFPVGPGDRLTVSRLRDSIQGPINIIASEKTESLDALKKLGVNRVSFGPFIFRSCLKKFIDIVDELNSMGSYKCFADNTISSADSKQYLTSGSE